MIVDGITGGKIANPLRFQVVVGHYTFKEYLKSLSYKVNTMHVQRTVSYRFGSRYPATAESLRVLMDECLDYNNSLVFLGNILRQQQVSSLQEVGAVFYIQAKGVENGVMIGR